MEYRQGSRLGALRRALAFVDKYAAPLGSVATSPMRKRLKRITERVEANGAIQFTCRTRSMSTTAEIHDLRGALRDRHMRPIVNIARARLLNIVLPMMTQFDVPHARTSDAKLLSAARSLAEAARPWRATFTGEGLPDRFVEQLETTTEALQTAIVERAGERLELRRATMAVRSLCAAGRQAIMALGAMIESQVYGNAPVIGEWEIAVRVMKKPGVARGSARVAAGIDPVTLAPTRATWLGDLLTRRKRFDFAATPSPS